MSRLLALFLGMLLSLLCAAASAQEAWVKYQHTSTKPAFSIEYPVEWPVSISEKVDDLVVGDFNFTGKLQVSFQTEAGTDPVKYGVAVYGLPGKVAGSEMQPKVLAAGAGNGMTQFKLNGQNNLQGDDRGNGADNRTQLISRREEPLCRVYGYADHPAEKFARLPAGIHRHAAQVYRA